MRVSSSPEARLSAMCSYASTFMDPMRLRTRRRPAGLRVVRAKRKRSAPRSGWPVCATKPQALVHAGGRAALVGPEGEREVKQHLANDRPVTAQQRADVALAHHRGVDVRAQVPHPATDASGAERADEPLDHEKLQERDDKH